jgi:hypothetical protein
VTETVGGTSAPPLESTLLGDLRVIGRHGVDPCQVELSAQLLMVVQSHKHESDDLVFSRRSKNMSSVDLPINNHYPLDSSHKGYKRFANIMHNLIIP